MWPHFGAQPKWPAICNWSKTRLGLALGWPGLVARVVVNQAPNCKQQTRFRGTSSSGDPRSAIHGATCLQTRSTLYVLHRNDDEEASVKLRCGPLSNLARLALGQPRVVFAGKWDHAWPRQNTTDHVTWTTDCCEPLKSTASPLDKWRHRYGRDPKSESVAYLNRGVAASADGRC